MSSTQALPRSTQRGSWLMRVVAVSGCALIGPSTLLHAAETSSTMAIREELRSFNIMGSVLHIAAHPDDENTQLITYLSKGRHYRAAYLSVTRGDGGQNELGSEFDAELGVTRTQELLAARRIDGGRQFFTRAIDFGYSKTVDETLRFWEREAVLGDVVRVIRTFRPDVIVTAFAPQPQPGNHGHHNASAILGLDAFKLAGDPQAYPEQLADGLTPWQAKRILQGAGPTDLRGTDPVTGESFAALSSSSRAMHRTQFGIPNAGVGGAPGGARGGGGAPAPGGAPAGGGGGGGGRGGSANFQVLAGDAAITDLMDGVDTSWNRIIGGAAIGKATEEIIAQFNVSDPSASVPALLALRALLAKLPSDIILDEKRAQLDRILQACLGLSVDVTVAQAEVVPGENLRLTNSATTRSNIPVRWTGTRYPNSSGARTNSESVTLSANQTVSRIDTVLLPASTRVSQAYWLREPASAGMFRVADVDRKLIGQPENPPAFPVELSFEVGGQTLVVPTEPVQVASGLAIGKVRRRIDVIPPVTVHFTSLVKLLAPGAANAVEIELTANRAAAAGTLVLDLPAGWKASPATQSFRLGALGSKRSFSFNLTAPAQVGSANLGAHVIVNGQRFGTDRVVIDYEHIPLQILQPAAYTKVVSVNAAIRGSRIGYLPGAGDHVAECIAQMGYIVTQLSGADLTMEKLRDLDTVVIGVRAFNERTDFAANLPGLLAWVEAGGTVVAQYNRPNALTTSQLGPYALSIQGSAPQLRVTDESSPVSFLAPQHAVLTTPNRIGPDDFTGWVQERGAYFASSWDTERYAAVLAFNDPGEAPLQSGVLIAPYGKGQYVYTSLGFFRQLPRGVPGAYRLFANLVSLGK